MWPLGLKPDSADFPFNTLGLDPALSRRQFLRHGVVSAASLSSMAALTRSAYGEELRERLRKKAFRGSAPEPPAYDAERLALINRTTFGFSRAWYDDTAAQDHESYVESQLDYASLNDSAMDARLAGYPTLTMSSQEILDTYDNDTDDNVPLLELMSASLDRAVYSERQLYEIMVEFWTDHFNIYIIDGIVPFLKTADDRDVIRQYALSTFPELLSASAHSAAMLFYLDNYANVVGAAQENYSRELMELHTLGVTGPFTQQDVEEVARCLTGWTIYDSPTFGEFAFWPPFHDVGAKVVLGQDIPAGGGESDGQTVLDILAYHPSTAEFIARKLCTKFLGYNPPEDVVEMVKLTYLSTGGDIKDMLRIILRKDVLLHRATPKLKRPFHHLASMIRATEADAMINLPPNYPYLFALLYMGHLPFYWPAPNGYPDALGAWGSSQLPRWQTASWFFDGVLPATLDLDGLMITEGAGETGQAAAIDRLLTGGTMSSTETTALQQYYDDLPPGDPFRLSDTFGLAASMPGTQWY